MLKVMRYYRNISVVDFLSNSEQQQEPENFFPIEIKSYISPEIGSLSRQGPASLGVMAGDKILEIDGKRVNHFSEVSDILIASSNSNVNLVIQRKGEIKAFTLILRFLKMVLQSLASRQHTKDLLPRLS